MSFKKKLLSTAMAVAMASGFAISQNASAVNLAENGIGQLLLAPYYTALGGYQTNFAIYNTRTDVAVKAKVVIRSYGHSIESRDFICYLTPGDVCRFEIVNEGGQAYLTSTDDSVRNHLGGWAYDPDVAAKGQPQVPLKIILEDSKMLAVDKNDYNEVGHVEVIGVYAVATNTTYRVVGSGAEFTIMPGMKKADLAKIFDIFAPSQVADNIWNAIANGTGTITTVPADAAFTSISNRYISSVGAQTVGHPRIDIAGDVTLVKTVDGKVADRMGYRIPALTGGVVTSTRFDAGVSKESPIGLGFGVIGAPDTTIAIEQALAATQLRSTYESNLTEKTASIVTFPTKYIHRGRSICGDGVINIHYSSPFNLNGQIRYNLAVFDNHENMKQETIFFSPSVDPLFPAEVNYFVPNWFANSGHFVLGIDPENGTCRDSNIYPGAPVLGFVHKYIEEAGAPTRSILEPMSHQCVFPNGTACN